MLLFIKLVYLIIIAVACAVGGLAPLIFKKWFGEKSLSYSNCLGSGILIGASFIHLLKDSQELLEDQYDFPLSNLFCAIGFFLSFILERVLFEHKHEHSMPIGLIEQTKHDHEEQDTGNELKLFSVQLHKKNDDETQHGEENSFVLGIGDINQTSPHDDGDDSMINLIDSSKKNHKHGHSHNHHKEKQDQLQQPLQQKKKFPFMLFAVLSLESFISGSALGIQDNEVSVFVTFLAIVSHIWSESFTLSASVMKTRQSLKTIYISCIIFSIVTPLGGLFGLISEKILTHSQSNFTTSILLALASGCFLYVAIFEILAEEFSGDDHHHHHHSDNQDIDIDIELDDDQENNVGHSHQHKHTRKNFFKWIKLFLVGIGFTFMSVIGIVV
ncbi:hypothetical protein CYY_002146 [Polysphondylium violaceum]|uniref:Zinc/iron permease n=1 Tax=Polysphondylium violaceum TaxID=133409 RepID=A0A8J4V762_9MYCE|nr:hypothetical protein CYY_002146 [Polysphondylium violaceum]